MSRKLTDWRAVGCVLLSGGVFPLGCGGQAATVPEAKSSEPMLEQPEPAALQLKVHNAFTRSDDPRWASLPSQVEIVELPPASTIRAEVPSGTRSVSFRWGDQVVVDDSAPFCLDEDAEAKPIGHDWQAGEYKISVEAFAGPGGQGEVLAQTHSSVHVGAAGIPESAAEGGHSALLFWKTDGGDYVTRDEAGNYVDLQGRVVLLADQVELEVRLEDQGHLLTKMPGAPKLSFAFQLLVPESYSPQVKYPLVVFLHHGWEVYRGTDNDGRPLESPLFSGPRSITRSERRSEFPSVVLVPQHTETTEQAGVHEEWAAFTDISKETGSFAAAETESRSARFTFGILDDLFAGRLPIAGKAASLDERRIYLTGHSMGGLGVWDWIARRPDYFAAAVPMAGYADHSTASKLTSQPIWAFHHELDCYNPIHGTEKMVARIKEESNGSAPVRFTRLSLDTEGKCDQAHFRTPEATWNGKEDVVEWMFSQVR